MARGHQIMRKTEAYVSTPVIVAQHMLHQRRHFISTSDINHIPNNVCEQKFATVNNLPHFVNTRNNNGPASPVGFLLLRQPYLLFEASEIYFYANGI